MSLADAYLFLYLIDNACTFFFKAGRISIAPFQWMHPPSIGTDVCFYLSVLQTLVLFLPPWVWHGCVMCVHKACTSPIPRSTRWVRVRLLDPHPRSVASKPRVDPNLLHPVRCHVAGVGGVGKATLDPPGVQLQTTLVYLPRSISACFPPFFSRTSRVSASRGVPVRPSEGWFFSWKTKP